MAELAIAQFKTFGARFMSDVPRWYTTPPIGQIPLSGQQVMSITASSAQSNAFDDQTQYVRLRTDTACRVEFGVNPTASSSSAITLAANQTEYFALGQTGLKLAVITF